MHQTDYTQPVAAYEQGDVKAAFIRKVYGHLAGAVAALAATIYVLVMFTPMPEIMLGFMVGAKYGWLMILGGFMVVGWLSRSLAGGSSNPAMQYAGLGLYIVAYSILFVPMIAIAMTMASNVLPMAAITTASLFGGLSLVVFTTRKDFSFLKGILTMGFLVAVGLIVAGTMFGFDLGLAFTGGMIVLACGAILYDTSNVLHHYPVDRHVAASLELFASVALLFWYVLQLFMSRD